MFESVGKNITRVDVREKVTGEAQFSTDISLPGMLVGKILRSPHPFAKILSIDTYAARRLPGARAAICSRDVKQFPYGPALADELALADGFARYAGDCVAAVAASDEDTAEEAIRLIDVKYEVLPPILDAEKAMAEDAALIHPELPEAKRNIATTIEFTRGEGEAAFRYADVIVEDRFITSTQYQGYLEPQACVAQWDANGKLTIWGSTQSPFRVRNMLAKALGLPEHRIRIVQPWVGGGFGGKVYLHPHFAIAAMLAKEAGKPVKIVYTREEDIISSRPRFAEIIDIKMGFKKDGTIVAKSLAVTGDCGAYAGSCPAITTTSLIRPDCVYRQTNLKAIGRVVYTNKIPRSPFRGYGVPEMLFAQESVMDMAAEKLGIDPVELRLKNCSHKGDLTVHGWILNSCGLEDCIKLAAERSGWQKKKRNPVKNRGMGIALSTHVSGQRAVHPLYDGSAASVTIDQFGKAKVISAESEIGQGMLTVFSQIAAEELGFNINDVSIMPFVDTDISPHGHGTSASRGTTMGGNAVRLAARNAKTQLIKYAAEKFKLNADEVEIRDSVFYRKGTPEKLGAVAEVAYQTIFAKLGGSPITGKGEYVVPPYVVMPDATKYGNYSVGYAFNAQIAEVEVDTETGKVKLLNMWVGEDLGKAINPKMCEGQIEGAVVQGMGFALSESYIWQNGRVLNTNLIDYKMQQFSDTPAITSILVESNEPGGPFGGKSLGEASMDPTAVAISNAVYNAIGVRIKELPLTPEKILKGLKEKK